MKNLAIMLLFIVLLNGCQDNSKERFFTNAISQVGDSLLKKYDRILIIPNEGCGGCILDATSYVINTEKPIGVSFHVIFTRVGDRKIFMNTVGNLIDKDVYTIDKKNILSDTKISSIYPQLLLVESGKVIKYKDFDSVTDADLIFR